MNVPSDSIQLATEIGRLDFLSAILACIAILFAIGAFPLWGFVMRKAERVANEAASEKLADAEERIEREAIKRMEEMLPGLVKDYVELTRSFIENETADEIAQAQEDEDQ